MGDLSYGSMIDWGIDRNKGPIVSFIFKTSSRSLLKRCHT